MGAALAAAAAAASCGPEAVARLEAGLRQKREQLLAEEAAWLSLRDNHARGPDEAEAAEAAAPPEAPADEDDDEAAAAGATEPGPAQAACDRALRAAWQHADGLEAFVARLDRTVARAEAAAAALARSHASERLALFPRVDSPAFLIRAILRPGAAGATAAGAGEDNEGGVTEEAEAGEQQQQQQDEAA